MDIWRFWFRVFVVLILASGTAPADEAGDSQALRLVDEGHALIVQKQFREAEDAFERALKRDRKLIPAMKGLGKVGVLQEDWGKAKKWYQKVLKTIPEDPETLYHLALSHRETGKFKATLFRKREWDKAERYFKRLIAADSLYLDGFYQYATLERYRRKYREAIYLGHRQVAAKPHLTASQRGLFRLYRYLLDHGDPVEAKGWLEIQGTEHADYFVGEAERLAGDLEQAGETLKAWLASDSAISPAPARLSLARVYYALGPPRTAEAYFFEAVDHIRNRLDAELIFEDVKYVVTDKELRHFLSLVTPEDYADFFRRFWLRRDPTPALSYNARLAEHYRRLMVAETYYRYDELRAWFNNPDKLSVFNFPPAFALNDRLNDKGLIYIRHGDPADRARTIDQDLIQNESWFYDPTPALPQMIFHFNIDRHGTRNNWRLAPYPPTLEDRDMWGPPYLYPDRFRDPLYQMQIQNEITLQSRQAVDVALRTDRHTWLDVDPLPFHMYIGFFKGKEKTDAVCFYGVPLSDKNLENLADTSAVYEYGMTLHDRDWNRVARQREGVLRQDMRWFEGMGLGTIRFRVKPDTYNNAFFIQQTREGRFGGWKGTLEVPAFSQVRLDVSSIVPAYEIAAADSIRFAFRDHRLVPNPTRRFDPARPMYVYFEVYNLTPDEFGTTSFVIEYTVAKIEKETKTVLEDLLRIFGSKDKPTTSVAIEHLGDTPDSAEYLALDLSNAGKGDFRLNVRVKDLHSGEEKQAFLDLELKAD